jgi:signal transduction histidine kinase
MRGNLEFTGKNYSESMELHEFFMQAPIPLAILSGPEHLFTLANEAFENFVGRSVIGKTILDIYNYEEAHHLIPQIDYVFRTGTSVSENELFFPIKDVIGNIQKHWINVHYYPFYGNNGKITGVLTFINDVTEIVNAKKIIEKSELHFREMSVTLEKERDLKEVFISTLSHDIRTPLTVAKMSAELIAKKIVDNPLIYKMAFCISSSIDRADRMIQNLLDASFIKAGEKLQLYIAQCSMNSIVASVVEDLSIVHNDRFFIRSLEEVDGFWDENGIRRVLENLLLNAVKYGKVNTIITIEIIKTHESVIVNIHNEGMPIEPDDIKTLFNRFKRLNSAIKSDQKGWGLGLTLVKGIIEAHGGSVQVKSLSGEGTTFSINLPIDTKKFLKQGVVNE